MMLCLVFFPFSFLISSSFEDIPVDPCKTPRPYCLCSVLSLRVFLFCFVFLNQFNC